MGVTTMLFNNAVMSKLGADALAVYGVIVNIGTFVQSMSYGTGQAAQPIISVNLGAGNAQRIVRVSRYGLLSALVNSGWRQRLSARLFRRSSQAYL